MKEKNLELVYGAHSIIELLKAKRRRLVTIYTTKPAPKIWSQIEPLLSKGTQIQYVDRQVLHKIADTTDHQGIVAYAMPRVLRTKFFEPEKHPVLLMLDGIQDPRNLGAILRSAYCTGVDGVILIKKNSAPLNATVIKASAGLSEHLEIFSASSAQSAVQDLKKAGYILYLAVLHNGENALQVTYKKPLCLVIGSEGAGISPAILSAGQRITLPQRSTDISYNASVAAGILLFLIGTGCNKI